MTSVSETMVERAADAMIAGMFALHELPLDAELYSKYLATAREALTAALSDQVVVPREPTPAMLNAGLDGYWGKPRYYGRGTRYTRTPKEIEGMELAYRAMIQAAPPLASAGGG